MHGCQVAIPSEWIVLFLWMGCASSLSQPLVFDQTNRNACDTNDYIDYYLESDWLLGARTNPLCLASSLGFLTSHVSLRFSMASISVVQIIPTSVMVPQTSHDLLMASYLSIYLPTSMYFIDGWWVAIMSGFCSISFQFPIKRITSDPTPYPTNPTNQS